MADAPGASARCAETLENVTGDRRGMPGGPSAGPAKNRGSRAASEIPGGRLELEARGCALDFKAGDARAPAKGRRWGGPLARGPGVGGQKSRRPGDSPSVNPAWTSSSRPIWEPSRCRVGFPRQCHVRCCRSSGGLSAAQPVKSRWASRPDRRRFSIWPLPQLAPHQW